MSNSGAVNLLVIHDRKEHTGVARRLEEAPVINKAHSVGHFQEWLSVKDQLGDYSVIIVHHDLGHYSSGKEAGFAVERIIQHLHEQYPHIRVGLVSGGCPHGKKEAIGLGVDFYFNPMDITSERLITIIAKGPVGENEQGRRGKETEIITSASRYYSPERR